MNERLVEDWLSKANERSYQTPFAQALLADGMQVLRVGHSSHEHGKDVIALDGNGKVHAYQLKDGDFDLKDFEKELGQVTALVETQVEHPRIAGHPKHQPWLVISGEVSMPVEDRIRVHNLAWRKRRYTPLKIITGRQLLAKFSKMAANARGFKSAVQSLSCQWEGDFGSRCSLEACREHRCFEPNDAKG